MMKSTETNEYSPVLRLQGLTKRYRRHTVLENCSLELPSGRIIGLCGPNGSGKTTLLKIIAGIIPATGGSVIKEKCTISFVLPTDCLYLWMRVKDALFYFENFYPDFDSEKARELLHAQDLAPEQKIFYLSHGNRERLCLLLSLCRRADLYLMDEPASGIDPEFKRGLKQLLLAHLPEGSTVLMATHLLRDFETVFDSVLLIREQKLELYDADEIRELLHRSVEDFYTEVIS